MKLLFYRGILILISILMITGCNTENHRKKITFYPVPDLTQVQGLKESERFDLFVSEQNAFVYHSYETRDSFEWYGDAGVMVNSPSYHGVSFAQFELNTEVEILVQTGKKILEWDVKPAVKNPVKKGDNEIRFSIEHPRKIVVSALLEGDSETSYFIISAEEPETNIPDKNDETVLWLEPGVHKYGQAWDPYTDGIKTLYLAPGAIVEATIKTKNKHDLKLLGRGILAQAFVTHAEEVENRQEQEWDSDWIGVYFAHGNNIDVDGITVMNSPGFQMEFAVCESVTINNIKLCGFGEHNNDGLHTYGHNFTVTNSFIASNDDRICITGLFDDDEGDGNITYDGTVKLSGTDGGNLTYDNIVMLGLHNNGGDFMLTWNGEGPVDNVQITNCYSLAPTNKGFIASKHGGSCIFTNIRVLDSYVYHGNLVSLEVKDSEYQGAGGGAIKDLYLKNITVYAPKAEIGRHMQGYTNESYIGDVIFENIIASDGKINSIEETNIEVNEFVNNVMFK